MTDDSSSGERAELGPAPAGDPRTDIDLAFGDRVADPGVAMAYAAGRAASSTFAMAAAAQQLVTATTGFAVRAMFAVALAACPQFHADKLPGAPADATFVDIDGVHVRYRDSGSGPAVVLVHGFGASSDSWLTVIPALERHHRVIAVDLKGFGWTSRPAGDYSPAAQAELVWRVLDHLKIDDVAIVGHSWGSSVSLAMAVAHPGRVRRVALYSAYVYDDQVPSFFRWAEKPGLGEVLFALYYRERIEDRAALAYHDPRWVTQARVDKVEAELGRPGTVAAALAAARRHHFGGLHEKLASFTRPVLLLWGDDDIVTPVRFGHRLVGELANASIVVYPRCGHIPMVEAPQSTRDLARFLAHDLAPVPPAPAPADPAPTDPVPSASGAQAAGGIPVIRTRSASTIRGAVAPSTNTTDVPVVLASFDDTGVPAILASSTATATAVDDEPLPAASRVPPPPLVPAPRLGVGADLAVLGTELTPRLYAAPRDRTELVVHGALRARDAQLYNLDLDRGLDTTGRPVFPVPLGGGQRIDALDLRLRTDLAVYAPGVGVAVKGRIDWLDNVALGGDPDLSNGSPATSGGQRPTAVVIKRAWGEVLLPFGTLAIGRMGAHFGLGIAAHGGDCEDCDGGDAADRAALVTPIAGHLLAVAYDIASSGPFTRSRDGKHALALEPSDRAAGPTLALLKVHSPAALARRAEAGRTSVEYGAYVTRRTQATDVPASYLPVAAPPTTFASADLVGRGFSTTLTGGWLRISNTTLRAEAEVIYAHANLEQPSLIPGAEITLPVTSDQVGAAIETAAMFGGGHSLGLDAGYASGDPAPGFGAFPAIGDPSPPAGAFDGAQANPPGDRTVDNFRFHPDYRIDQILFREIIGTITDAVYLRPHARTTLLAVGSGALEFGVALIASWAVEPTSTPSGARALGIELDPELRFAHRDGFAATLSYGLLFPGAAFDNTNLDARPAQTLRARIAFVF